MTRVVYLQAQMRDDEEERLQLSIELPGENITRSERAFRTELLRRGIHTDYTSLAYAMAFESHTKAVFTGGTFVPTGPLVDGPPARPPTAKTSTSKSTTKASTKTPRSHTPKKTPTLPRDLITCAGAVERPGDDGAIEYSFTFELKRQSSGPHRWDEKIDPTPQRMPNEPLPYFVTALTPLAAIEDFRGDLDKRVDNVVAIFARLGEPTISTLHIDDFATFLGKVYELAAEKISSRRETGVGAIHKEVVHHAAEAQPDHAGV